ncbi:hypothetical protein [Bryobacter aggregatus]|uniref:hypothetical protein n=1 Tax=Bryobacter aggregatus TaxID=360054 RepID=UPI0004E0C86B|nr:hypothetical protein [Bryobacter aggregatus]
MRSLKILLLLSALTLQAAQTVLVLTTDGKWVEGTTPATKAGSIPLAKLLSIHNGAPASPAEAAKITAGFQAILGDNRAARDLAVEDLTNIGLPVLTPLLAALKDTDQHEPKPLYNLFNRVVPSSADQYDRSAALVRLDGARPSRGSWPTGEIKIGDQSLPWASIRMLAVRRKNVTRAVEVHSLRHCTQIEYLDTGVFASKDSKLTTSATGFTRLSWHQDEWATDPNGLTKPGPNYKTNLVDGHPFGALVGRLTEKGPVLFLGRSSTKAQPGEGRLHLAINDNKHWQNNLGSYQVTVQMTDAYDLGAAL